MAIDMSSAFDVVHKEILVKKMEIYRMDEAVTKWIKYVEVTDHK